MRYDASAHHVQVEDQLGQILDGVDVMVGRGGDEGDAGLAPPQLCDVGADLLAWQLPTLTCTDTAVSPLIVIITLGQQCLCSLLAIISTS